MDHHKYEKTTGEVCWQSPSNIALIKYWGKKGFQLPANASLSMTLSKSFTETNVGYAISKSPGKISFGFLFDGEKAPLFEAKIKKYFGAIVDEFPFLMDFHLMINSRNTFPHSAGIASSASAMSALAMCLCSIEQQVVFGKENFDEGFYRKASNLARIGSGSASRSIYGGLASWGETDLIEGSSDLFATRFAQGIHPDFIGFCNSILIVSKSEKKVSSRAGHALMKGHPYADMRYAQAKVNLKDIMFAIETGDLQKFITVVETEALSLHAMLATSNPGVILFDENTMVVIKKIVKFREQSGANVCFTLDAGPNVHVLYPEKESEKVKLFIREELLQYCADDTVIEDMMGPGPKQLSACT